MHRSNFRTLFCDRFVGDVSYGANEDEARRHLRFVIGYLPRGVVGPGLWPRHGW